MLAATLSVLGWLSSDTWRVWLMRPLRSKWNRLHLLTTWLLFACAALKLSAGLALGVRVCSMQPSRMLLPLPPGFRDPTLWQPISAANRHLAQVGLCRSESVWSTELECADLDRRARATGSWPR